MQFSDNGSQQTIEITLLFHYLIFKQKIAVE